MWKEMKNALKFGREQQICRYKSKKFPKHTHRHAKYVNGNSYLIRFDYQIGFDNYMFFYIETREDGRQVQKEEERVLP